MCCCMVETSSVLPRSSSEIFGHFWKMFGKDCLAFGYLQKIVKKVVISMFIP